MPRKEKSKRESVDLGDLSDTDTPSVEPYSVLGLSKTASPDEIKNAYRKSALKHHPDKAAPELKEQAHTKFQEIAFAYAVLSDPIRRKRYDATGSTAESLSIDDDFDWNDYYRSQFKDVITTDAIEEFSRAYKGSVEEKDDVLAAYRHAKGNWDEVYSVIMLSNPVEDEDRFREYIDEAIERGDAKAYKSYKEESDVSKKLRLKRVAEEAGEAEEYAKELGVHDAFFGGKKGKKNGEDALMALIQNKQRLGNSFLDKLEEKYGGASKKSSKSKKKSSANEDDGMAEPSEEAFQAAAARLKQRKEKANSGEVKEPKPKRVKH